MTGTIFSRHKLHVEEMFYIVFSMEGKSIGQIAKELA
ncbi:hypothetical protein HRbin02_01238 [Candidatus Calditenuaceae archaeon HR02]|nr:hypothetical protein HRbin02_01238 [Candidatus Calditenuaceae archaeon HR02]